MSKITDRLHAMLHDLATKFEQARHPAAAELRAIHTRLDADAATLAGDATADARHVATDAEHAAAPVVTEVKIDGAQLYKQIKGDTASASPDAKTATEQAAQPPAAPSA